jgi:hypothetical protein
MKLTNFFLFHPDICANHAGLVAFQKTVTIDFIFGSKIDSKLM